MGWLLHLNFDFPVVEEPLPEKLAQLFAGVLAALAGRQQQIEEPLFSGGLGAALDLFGLLRADQIDSDFHEVADHGFHVAAHIAHLGVLGGLHLDEGSRAQLGEAAGDLGLAHARGPHHDDVARRDLVAQFGREALTPPAVAHRHGHHALGLFLPDDVFVQFRDDLAGGQFAHVRSFCEASRRAARMLPAIAGHRRSQRPAARSGPFPQRPPRATPCGKSREGKRAAGRGRLLHTGFLRPCGSRYAPR